MRTFYTVAYNGLGFDSPRIRWFDNRDEANEFSKKDYADKPIRHTYTNEQRIEEAEEAVILSRCDWV